MGLEDDLRDALRARAGSAGRAPDDLPAVRAGAAARRRRASAAGFAGVVAVAGLGIGAASLATGPTGEPAGVVAGPGPTTTTTGAPSPSTSTTPATTAAPPTSSSPATSSSSSAVAPSSTAKAPASTTTTTAARPRIPADARVLWPPPGGLASASPSAAATDFARRFAGMATPSIGATREAEPGLVEVDVRPRAGSGGTTTLQVARVADGWAVRSAQAARILVDSPTAGARVGGSVEVRGRCDTYEGGVTIQLRRHGGTVAVATASATGMQGELGPYAATLAHGEPAGRPLVVVVLEPRADDERAGPNQLTAFVVER